MNKIWSSLLWVKYNSYVIAPSGGLTNNYLHFLKQVLSRKICIVNCKFLQNFLSKLWSSLWCCKLLLYLKAPSGGATANLPSVLLLLIITTIFLYVFFFVCFFFSLQTNRTNVFACCLPFYGVKNRTRWLLRLTAVAVDVATPFLTLWVFTFFPCFLCLVCCVCFITFTLKLLIFTFINWSCNFCFGNNTFTLSFWIRR